MPTALIFGGSGKVARQLTTKLVGSSYNVFSLIRNKNQCADLEALGAKTIVQSIEDSSVDDLTETIKRTNPDVVVWSAGAGGGNPERTKTVDHEGAVKSFDATAKAGVKRYIIVSAIDVRDRSKAAPDWYNNDDKDRSERVWGAIGAYMQAKLSADKDLVENNSRRKLDYTIVRPGGLTMEAAAGKVAAGKVHLSATISREDVAEVVKYCIEEPATIGLVFDVVGGETPTGDAIRQVAEQKVNTFVGHY